MPLLIQPHLLTPVIIFLKVHLIQHEHYLLILNIAHQLVHVLPRLTPDVKAVSDYDRL